MFIVHSNHPRVDFLRDTNSYVNRTILTAFAVSSSVERVAGTRVGARELVTCSSVLARVTITLSWK